MRTIKKRRNAKRQTFRKNRFSKKHLKKNRRKPVKTKRRRKSPRKRTRGRRRQRGGMKSIVRHFGKKKTDDDQLTPEELSPQKIEKLSSQEIEKLAETWGGVAVRHGERERAGAVVWYPAKCRQVPTNQLPERVALGVDSDSFYVQGMDQGMPLSKDQAFKLDLKLLNGWVGQGSIFKVKVIVPDCLGPLLLDLVFNFDCSQAADLHKKLMDAAYNKANLRSKVDTFEAMRGVRQEVLEREARQAKPAEAVEAS